MSTISFKVMSTLGVGPDGCKVKLVQHPHTAELAAVRLLNMSCKKYFWRPSDHTTLTAIDKSVADVRRLRHPNLCHIYEVIDDPSANRTLVVMQYVPRGPLLRIAVSDLPSDVKVTVTPIVTMNERRAAHFVRQVSSAIRYLHRRNIVHGALKPSNILMDDDGNVVITDIGGSRWFLPHQLHPVRDTQSINEWFVAPEGRHSTADATSASAATLQLGFAGDVWSIGMLGLLLTAANPLSSASLRLGVLDCPSKWLPRDMSAEGKDFLIRVLHPDPTKRLSLHDVRCHPWLVKPITVPSSSDAAVSSPDAIIDSSLESVDLSHHHQVHANRQQHPLPGITSPSRSTFVSSPSSPLGPCTPPSHRNFVPERVIGTRVGCHHVRVASSSPSSQSTTSTPRIATPCSPPARSTRASPQSPRSLQRRIRHRLRVVTKAVLFMVKLSMWLRRMRRYHQSLIGKIPSIIVDPPPPPTHSASAPGPMRLNTTNRPLSSSRKTSSAGKRRSVMNSLG